MNKEIIENILKDYHWMLKSIKKMRESLNDAGESITARYGIEASMPKQKGKTGDPVFGEVVRRNKYHKRIEEYEEKVKMIQERIHLITDNREVEVLNWLLEGKSYRWIAGHMGLSETHIRRIKDSIAEKMSQKAHMSHMSQKAQIF